MDVFSLCPVNAIIASALWTGCLSAQPGNPTERARYAQQLVTAGKPEEAIAIYRDLVRAFPNNAVLLQNLSIAEYTARHYQEAISDAGSALKSNPNLTPARLFLGASYLELREYAPALEALEKVLAVDANEQNARFMYGEALLGARRYQEALESFRKSREMQPENPKVWYGLGRASEALAQDAARQLESIAPHSAYWFAVAGDAYLAQRRLGSAFAAYRKSLNAGPPLAGVWAGLGKIYSETGHPDWARKATEFERRAAPVERADSGPAALYAAYLAYRQQAKESYDRLEHLPASLEKYLHLARTLDARGEYIEAAQAWRKALDLSPGSAEIQTGLVWALYRCRDYGPVLKIAAEILSAQPGSAELNFLYGATLLNLQQPEQAIPSLTAALKADPQFAPAHAALGQALLQTGKASEAVSHLRAGIATDTDGNTHFQLLRAYQLMGNTEMARKAMVEYQEFRSSIEEKKAAEDGAGITPP